jgi:hypothetical protein
MLTFGFTHKIMRDIKFRGIKKETKESGFYGGYFSNTDEEGLEHLYLKFTTEGI